MLGTALMTSMLAMAPGVAQSPGAAEGPTAMAFIDSVQRLDPEQLEAWVRQIAAGDPEDASAVVSEVVFGLTFWLTPHAERAAQTGVYPDPGLGQAIADAARALAAVGPRAAVRLAELATAQPLDLLEVELAVGALQVLGSDARGAIPVLEAALGSESSMSRSAAAIGLAFVDGPEYPTLRRALGSDDSDVREAAVRGLGRTRSGAALQPLLTALDDPDLAWVACSALAELGALALPALPKLLASDHVEAEHLSKIGEAAIPLLVEAAHGVEDLRRNIATHALARIGAPAMPSLLALAADPDPAVRMAVATAAIEEPLEPLTPGLVLLLQDHDPQVRVQSIAALAAIDSATALQGVLAAARDPHPRVAYEAIVALGRFESDPETVRQALMAGLPAADLYRRSAAMLGLVALLHVTHAEELEAILERLRDTDPEPRIRASAEGYRASVEGQRQLQAADPDTPPPPEPPRPSF